MTRIHPDAKISISTKLARCESVDVKRSGPESAERQRHPPRPEQRDDDRQETDEVAVVEHLPRKKAHPVIDQETRPPGNRRDHPRGAARTILRGRGEVDDGLAHPAEENRHLDEVKHDGEAVGSAAKSVSFTSRLRVVELRTSFIASVTASGASATKKT